MSQHDFNIANQTASATRADLNNALGALASLSSGTTAPSTTYANMLWYETDTNWLWVRNEADSAWIRFAYFDQSTGRMAIQDNTEVVGTGGSQTGLLGNQTTATWQAGTGTTQSLVSPANVKAAVLALAPVNTSTVLAATAGAGVGAIGSYALLQVSTAADDTARSPGSTLAGTSLHYANASSYYGTTASGTWRLMGQINQGVVGTTNTSVWLRIS